MAARRGHGDGSIFYEPERQRWLGKLELPDDGTGKRRRAKVVGRTKTEVRVKLQKLRQHVDRGLPTGHGTMTFGALLDHWLAEVVPARGSVKSPNTIDNYRWAVNHHLKPALGSKRVTGLRPEHIEALLRRLAEEGMAKTSVARIRSVAVLALRYAQRRELVARNAAELAELPAGARPRKEGRSLTLCEARSLLDAAEHDPSGPLVIVGLMLGLRPGELCGLRWADVDLEAKTLTVSQARLRERGDEGREVLRFGNPKTRKSRRTLGLPAPVVDTLNRPRANQERQRLSAESWEEFDLVFTTSTGTPLDPSNLRRSLERLTRAAGLGKWTPRELGRHTAASLLSAAGVPIEVVADLLGHVDTRMLEKHYRHRVTPTIDAAVAPMENMFGDLGPESNGSPFGSPPG